MFTIKLYADLGARMRIHAADDFTILSVLEKDTPMGGEWVEITAHRKIGVDIRFDIGPSPYTPEGGVWDKAIIENAMGRTTEIIDMQPARSADKAA